MIFKTLFYNDTKSFFVNNSSIVLLMNYNNAKQNKQRKEKQTKLTTVTKL